MPRYFFDIHDGIVTCDEEGQDLPDLAAARRIAMNSLPTVAAEEIPADGDRQCFVVLVKDENKRPVYSATLNYIGMKLC